MRLLTSFTLAAIAIMMAAVAPQRAQARLSGRSLSPASNINSRVIQTDPNPTASAFINPLSALQNGEKIVTKALTSGVYIGNAYLPSVGTSTVYYTYSESGTDPFSGSALTESNSDNYNVAASIDQTGKLLLTFKNLKVEKSYSADGSATAVAILNMNSITVITLVGDNSLTGADMDGGTSCGLLCNGSLAIEGTGTMTVTGGTAFASIGMASGRTSMAISLNGGSIKAIGGKATRASYGLWSETKGFTIQGSGAVTAIGGISGMESYGIFSHDLIDFAGGSLTASGGTATNSYGIATNAMNISAGIATINGHTSAIYKRDQSDYVPVIYNGAKIQAGTAYDGSNAQAMEYSALSANISTYQYLHVGGLLKLATIEGINNSYEYTGYPITPKPVVKDGDDVLVEGTDYTVTYSDNTEPGTATVTITGTGIYVGTQTVTFTIKEATPTNYAYVNLPFVEGIKTNPIAGTYAVTKGESFSFTLSLNEGYGESKPTVTANKKEITPNKAGTYVIENITENMDIKITGITATGIEGVSAKTAIYANGRNLKIYTARPQQVQVVSILGKVACMRNIPAGNTTIDTLSAGIYIVRLADGTIAKVIIR